MESDYSYKFTEKAENDLDEILRYMSRDLHNPSAASSFGRKIFERIDAIRNFPLSGRLVENEFLSNKTVRRVAVDNYALYYVLSEKEKTVYVVRIVYAKRNLEEIYRSMTD